MALGTVKDDFSWFCGVLKLPTNVSLDDPDDGRNNVEGHEDDNGPWLCVVSAVGTALHSVFLLLFVVLLVIFTCRLNAQSSRTSNPQRCPGNVLRWLILAFLLFILSCAIGEGVLTDSTRPQVFPTQPYLYLPSLCALLATFTAAVYYNSMERWRKFHMSLLSISYWITCFAIQAATLWCLIQLGHGSVEVLRFDLSLCLLAAYVVFIILDLLVLKTLVPCRNLSYRPTPTSDSIPGDLYYVHDDVSVLSQVTLGWLTKFLRLGNKRSLERKDLGSLPERHTSQENFKRFKEVFLKEKANALKNNQKVSLFRVFGHFCGIRLLAVGLLKVVSVFVKFVTPAAIRGIVLYAAAQKYRDDSIVEEDQHFITVSEFLSNGYILLFILFVAKLSLVFCARSVQYFLTVQAIHTKIALQGMVYDKSLCLALNGGGSKNGITAGKLVNYMSTDPANLQQMFMEFHSIWITTLSVLFGMRNQVSVFVNTHC